MLKHAVSFVRWSARLSALLIASMFMYFVVSELYAPQSGPPASMREWAGIVLMTLTVGGMVAAWWRELPGAVVSLTALALFVCIFPMRQYGVAVVAAIPGVLYLLGWAMRRPLDSAPRTPYTEIPT